MCAAAAGLSPLSSLLGPPPTDVASKLVEMGVEAAALTKLTAYVEILDKWRRRINLVGPTDAIGLWRRHVLDCAQAWPHIVTPDAPLLDLGSGAGLPGLILAILGARNVTLIDSDRRKAVFLGEAARTVGVRPTILAERFDQALRGQEGRFKVATARAAAPLPKLMPILDRALEAEGYALLHKGESVESELTEARKSWNMQVEKIPSVADERGVLLKIWGIEPNDGQSHA